MIGTGKPTSTYPFVSYKSLQSVVGFGSVGQMIVDLPHWEPRMMVAIDVNYPLIFYDQVLSRD